MSPKLLQTTIAGSLPRPAWLIESSGRSAVEWRLQGDELREALDDATLVALEEQEDAGIDLVTDGEVRRRNYIWGFIEGLSGIDTEQLGTRLSRGGRYGTTRNVARIVGPVARERPVLLDALRFARAHTDRLLKVTLPGPMTIVDTALDEHYNTDDRSLALRFAEVLNQEARDLAAAGADVVQFDEPCFNIYVDDVIAWGMEALEACMAGVGARTAVHICYGYGVPAVLDWKTKNQDWSHYSATLQLLARSSVDMVSVECAASGVDVSVLSALRGKDVMLGVIDVGTEEVESAALVAARIEAALPYVSPEHLYPCTDCGLVPRSRSASAGKLRALVAGAALARSRLSLTPA